MDKEDAIKLFETVLTALACPLGLLPIMDRDATKDIPKVHLKPEEPPTVPLKIPRYEPLYLDDTGLYEAPLPYLLVGMNDKIDTSKTVYVRLNEKHEPDGIVEVPEDSTEKTLKPCPFCGGDIKFLEPSHTMENFVNKPTIVCENCGYSIEKDSRLQLFRMWNKRTEA